MKAWPKWVSPPFLKLSVLSLLVSILLLGGLNSCAPQNFHQATTGTLKNQSRFPANRDLSLSEEPIHLIFDLDWTLVVPLTKEQEKLVVNHPLLIRVFDEPYLLKEGAREILNEAFKRPNTTVSFFSGGNKVRNDELLKKIILDDGKSAYDKAKTILSRNDLTVISNDKKLRFSQRYKKDIRKVTPFLEQALLIEDIENFALGPGTKQTLWLGKTYFPRLPNKSWSESNEIWRATGVEERFLAPSMEASWWNQRKLFYFEAMLSKAKTPGDIIELAQNSAFSDELPPDNWQSLLEDRTAYRQFLLKRPCDSLIPF